MSHRIATTVDDNAVLSFNPDGRSLFNHELALRDGGYAVISVSTGIQARFEIEMGRCGIFLLSHIVPPLVCLDLVGLFLRRYCHDRGIVIFLAKDPQAALPDADILCVGGGTIILLLWQES